MNIRTISISLRNPLGKKKGSGRKKGGFEEESAKRQQRLKEKAVPLLKGVDFRRGGGGRLM